ncbi:APC family permease [bacterium]|nr:APC family permease [bacterium]
MTSTSLGRLRLPSAVGLAVATMIGSGVFVTSGLLARDLSPAAILLEWLLGGVLAACGATCYAAVAAHVPRSGGEYRFLHDLYHPFAGYAAGWVTIVFGFAAPIAMAAMAAGAYAEALGARGLALPVALALVIGLGAIQASGLKWGGAVQNLGVVIKLATVLLFVGAALFSGILDPLRALPGAETLQSLTSMPFAVGQIYVGFAFTGWSAAVYMASEVEDPARNVPRAMWLGCGLVAAIYLLLNFVFVTALSGAELATVAQSQSSALTLGHLVATKLLGPIGGVFASCMILAVLVSSVVAMSMTGPRVCAAMAEDGYLPRWVRWRPGPWGGAGSVGLMTALAAGMTVTNSFELLLGAVGVTLAIFGALSACAVLRIDGLKLGFWRALALSLYLLGAGWGVFSTLRAYPSTLAWMVVTLGAAAIAYRLTSRKAERHLGLR